jgi:hypothetical protein
VQVATVTGELVESSGCIDLFWKLEPDEHRYHYGKFRVLWDVEHLDVLFGQDTIGRDGFLIRPPKSIAGLTVHERPDAGM